MENGFRALEAYDEALRVRTQTDAPGEYANTLSNKANCLANLPDDPANADDGNSGNLRQAVSLYREAMNVFRKVGEIEKVEVVSAAILDLESELNGAANETSLAN